MTVAGFIAKSPPQTAIAIRTRLFRYLQITISARYRPFYPILLYIYTYVNISKKPGENFSPFLFASSCDPQGSRLFAALKSELPNGLLCNLSACPWKVDQVAWNRFNPVISRVADQAYVMYQPAHLDGRTVVVLRSAGRGYHIVESGYLSFDGETLFLVGEESQRPFSDAEVDALKLVAPGNRIPDCRGFDFFLIAEESSASGPFHRRLDRLFRSESQQAWWLLKIAGAGLVGLVLAIRVAWMNRDRFAIAAHVATLVVVPAAAMGCAVALMRADIVRRRLRRGDSVGLLSRILFGAGIWSLLIWIVGALLIGFPLAVWLGTLTADRPAG